MKMTAVNEVQFASLNNKRYYYLDGITSLPNGHPLLLELTKESISKNPEINQRRKNKFLKRRIKCIKKIRKNKHI